MKRKIVIALFVFLLFSAMTVKAEDSCGISSAVAKLYDAPQKKLTPKKNFSGKKLKESRVHVGAAKSSELIYQYGQVFLSSAPNHKRTFTQTPVKNGDLIRTGDQSFAVIKTANGSHIKVLSNSHVYLRSINRTPIHIELKHGRIDGSVESSPTPNKHTDSGNYKFLLTTPSLNMGVRGTQFKVAHHVDDSQVSVNRGVVDVQPTNICGRVTELKANEGASVTKTGLNKVKLLDSPDLSHVPNVFESTHALIQFGSVLGVDHYRIRVAYDFEFIYLIKEQLSQQPEFKLEGLDNGYYYIKVTAVDHNGIEGIPSKIRILFQYN